MNYEITVTLPPCFALSVSRFLGQLFSSLVHVIYDNLTSLFRGPACFAGADIFIPKTAKQGGWLYSIIVLLFRLKNLITHFRDIFRCTCNSK